jgi:NitT/TauT family transport system substrate-binding protein
MTRRRFLSSAISAVSLAACDARPRRRLRVGTSLWTGYEPFFIARHLGAYDQQTIQLIEFPASSDAALAFQNRALDVVALSLDGALRIAANGHDIRIFLVADYSTGGDVIVGRPEINGIADLRGRTVGFEANALGAFVLARALEKHNLQPGEIRTTVVRADQIVTAFATRKLDAVVAYEPHRSELLKAGARELFTSNEIPGEIADVLITRKALLHENLPALRQLTDGWFRAIEHLAAHPAEAAAIVAPREKKSPQAFLESLKLLRMVDRAENRKLLSPDDATLPEHIRRLSSFMVRQNLLASAVDPAMLRDDRLVKEAAR